ncbi:Smr/MutS family protein [Sphingomonas sp. Root241]|uniref:Smr/MutS family protein n=1 Tax=Sphingomonas sp. Root241 TaxID=1736501 RepID=UPI001F1F2820|nr:Smr/MutS family protein [Sphingomonas sp. Root241]
MTPLKAPPVAKAASSAPILAREGQGVGASGAAASRTPIVRMPKEPPKRAEVHPQPLPANREGSKKDTLDGSWDRRLSRGLISPESSIDLHGHNLASAYDRLDHGLEQAIRRGDRVLLLITGKPPRPESERPHARGAIRAAVGDWLASSRYADRIAAVRAAHPRHGGSGALYIILRRPRTPPPRNS